MYELRIKADEATLAAIIDFINLDNDNFKNFLIDKYKFKEDRASNAVNNAKFYAPTMAFEEKNKYGSPLIQFDSDMIVEMLYPKGDVLLAFNVINEKNNKTVYLRLQPEPLSFDRYKNRSYWKVNIYGKTEHHQIKFFKFGQEHEVMEEVRRLLK